MSNTTFSGYDTADYLQTEEDMQLYLEAAVEDGDASAITAALGNIARARNISKLARETGMSREGVYKALSGESSPSFATVIKLTRALGYSLDIKAINA